MTGQLQPIWGGQIRWKRLAVCFAHPLYGD